MCALREARGWDLLVVVVVVMEVVMVDMVVVRLRVRIADSERALVFAGIPIFRK